MIFVFVNFFSGSYNAKTFSRLSHKFSFFSLTGKQHFIIPDFTDLCRLQARCARLYNTKTEGLSLTMNARLMQAPVDAQAVLLLLHASPALAAMQGTGQQRRHSVGTLAAGAGAQLHAAVSRHTLAQCSQAWATHLVTGAGVPRQQTVSPSRQGLLKHCGGEGKSWWLLFQRFGKVIFIDIIILCDFVLLLCITITMYNSLQQKRSKGMNSKQQNTQPHHSAWSYQQRFII